MSRQPLTSRMSGILLCQSMCWMILIAAYLAVSVMAKLDAAESAPLNLLIIQTDEHHYGTLGCYGGTIVKTPNIDWIARQGARCDSFYATTPVCSPSRAALVTGRYPQKTPVVNNNIPLDDSVVTFAELLRRKGYQTGFAGKWHLDGSGKPQWAPKRKFGFTGFAEDVRVYFYSISTSPVSSRSFVLSTRVTNYFYCILT